MIKPHKLGSLTFDVTYFEEHNPELEITEQPVELGAAITDHAYVKPTAFTIGVAIADRPLKANSTFGPYSNARSSSGYQQVLTLMNSRTLITVQTGLINYNNVLIKNITVIQDVNSQDVANLIISCRQIFIITTQTVMVPVQFLAPGPTQDIAAPVVTNGTQLTVKPTPAQVSAIINLEQHGYL